MGHNKPFGASPETNESLESLPGKIVKGVGEEAHKAINSLWEQMLGGGTKHGEAPPSYDASQAQSTSHGEAPPPYDAESSLPSYEASKTNTLMEGVLFQLGLHKNQEKMAQQKEGASEVRPGIDYHKEYFDDISNFEKKADNREKRELNEKIQEIQNELKRLVASTKEFKHHFADVVVAPPLQNPGKYHENFFDWLLIMVKQARQKVENSNSWLGAVQGKGKNKKGYWDRAEKEGTTFTQNNERSAATSTG